jgi:hypothetical protein
MLRPLSAVLQNVSSPVANKAEAPDSIPPTGTQTTINRAQCGVLRCSFSRQVFAADPFYAAAPASVDDVYIYALRGAGTSRPRRRSHLHAPLDIFYGESPRKDNAHGWCTT